MNAAAKDWAGYQDAILTDIRALAEEIGVRFAGTKGDALAADYVARRFQQNGLAPEKVPFRVMGWKPTRDARLLVRAAGEDDRQLACFPYVFSSSTPQSGFSGRLVYWGRQELLKLDKFRPFERHKFRFRKYSIINDAGAILAHVVSRDFPHEAKASPWGALPLPLTTPTVIIGEKDGRLLETLVASGRRIEASLSIAAEFDPSAVTYNIYARLAGSDARNGGEEILIAAHSDSQYVSPGAVDDASGVACLLALTRHFQEKSPRRSLLFAVYGAEEIGLVGSGFHCDSLRAQGKLSSIRAVLNLDMLCCNEPNWVHASEDFLAQESVRRAAKDIEIERKYGRFEIVTPPWPSGDQDPFYDEGIPCVSFTWKGYKYPFTHLPDDTMDKVNTEVLMDSFHLARSVVEHMDRML
jgi:aminopeptidase YwaD